MDVTYENPHKIYVKSNTVTTMRLLWFLSALLLVLVIGLCVFVAFGRDDANDYHWNANGQFYYTLDDHQATIVKFTDNKAETYIIPSNVHYGGANYPVTKIGERAFTNHRNLTSVEIPDSVTEIMGDRKKQTGAFSGCVALAAVDLGQGVTSVGDYAFKNCLALTNIELPVSMQFVGDGAFQGCLALTTIGLNSNGILGDDCFANCLNVTNLQLADDVLLSDGTRQEFAGLTKLSKFVITENHTAYTLKTTGNGDCLLASADNKNDTVVLGGAGAVVPDGVTQILDWAWGKRAVAQLITFVATEDHEVQTYIYREADGTVIYPDYTDLFADVESATPFIKWGEISESTCHAVYATRATSLEKLTAAVDAAEEYFSDDEETRLTRLQFAVDFWEQFKTLYYSAAVIVERGLTDTTYEHVVTDLTQTLEKATKQITTSDETILESTNWWIGLRNLIDVVDTLDAVDLAGTLKNDKALEQLIEKTMTAEFMVMYHNRIDDGTGKSVWLELRNLYETLEVDTGVDSSLGKEIAACEKIKQADYTQASWQNLQAQLASAKQIVDYNLTRDLLISTIRENLADARADLREVTWADNLVCLRTWISVCNDLPSADYQATEYDRLLDEVRTVAANINDLVNNTEVNAAIGNLQNRYDNLVPSGNTTTYQTGTGILNKKSLPYFITAVILFTGSVASGAVAAKIKHELRQSQE